MRTIKKLFGSYIEKGRFWWNEFFCIHHFVALKSDKKHQFDFYQSGWAFLFKADFLLSKVQILFENETPDDCSNPTFELMNKHISGG